MAGAADVHYVRMNNVLVSAYVTEPERRSSRRDRLLADPRKRAAIEKARRKIASAISDTSEFSLAKLRLQAGLSQAQLAKLVDSQQPAIARLEKGDIDPGVSTIEKLAEALGVPSETVFKAFTRTKQAQKNHA